MKTIEERAKEKFPYPISNMQMAYIQGAQEQHDIDMQRVCEWLEQNTNTYVDDWYGFNMKEFISDFKQDMKGE